MHSKTLHKAVRIDAVRPELAFALLVALSCAAGAFAVSAAASDDRPEFDRTIILVERGETAEIALSVPDGDPVRIAIESEDVGVRVAATVVDGDGDGSVTLLFDTGAVEDGAPETYVSVSEGDDLRDATEYENDVGDELPAENYDLGLFVDDERVDVGTLAVSDSTSETEDAEESDSETTRHERVDGAVIVHGGEELTLEAGPEQTITGEADLDAGEEISVRIRSTGDDPFLRTTTATVSEHGTFEATFDLHDVPPGTSITVSASHPDVRATADGRVVECPDCETPTPNPMPTGDGVAIAQNVDVVRGNVAEIPVTFGDEDALTVVVGDERVNYRLVATIRDRDDAGHGMIQFHTDQAGFDRHPISFGIDGSQRVAEIHEESELPGLLDAGEYPVAVYPGEETDGDPAATGTVIVHDAPAFDELNGTECASDATAEESVGGDGATTGKSDGSDGVDRIGGFGAIGLGGLLSFLGIGVLLDLFRR